MLVGPHAPVIGVIDFRFIESESVISFLGRIEYFSSILPRIRIFNEKAN